MFDPIDWEQQWAFHAVDFRDGCAHIPLPNHEEVLLYPGPGFGDFSHPTTRLMVELMAPVVYNKPIFDVGCGSGILSIAAAKLGASRISLCDIDPAAVQHAKKNAAFNHVEISNTIDRRPVVLMNMIFSEQQEAWKIHRHSFDALITSGILASQKETYLTFAVSEGWQLIDERESNGWMGFYFKEMSL